MAYSNLTNTGNYQLASFGQKGFKVISAETVTGHFNAIQVLEGANITLVAVNGEGLTSQDIQAGITIFGLFTSVVATTGKVLAYIA